MIVELAIATHTAPRDWWDEDDSTLATAVAVIEEAEGRAARNG